LLERIAALPEEMLADVEESVDEIERWRGGIFRLTDEERAAVRNGIDAARRGAANSSAMKSWMGFIVVTLDESSPDTSRVRRPSKHSRVHQRR
jgi:hypothetical protein